MRTWFAVGRRPARTRQFRAAPGILGAAMVATGLALTALSSAQEALPETAQPEAPSEQDVPSSPLRQPEAVPAADSPDAANAPADVAPETEADSVSTVGEPSAPSPTASPQSARGPDPHQLLELMGLDQSHFDRLTDGQPWIEGENELLLRLLFRMPSFRALDIYRWAKPLPPMNELFQDPGAYRGRFFALRGRVLSIEPQRPLPEMAERFEFDVYYRCKLELAENKAMAVVFTRVVPDEWASGGPIDEQCGANGMFLKVGGPEANPNMPFFAARRLAWYPDTLLGKLGMDYGLFEDVEDRRSLTRRERDAFYRMLMVAGYTNPTQLMRRATQRAIEETGQKDSSVVPLFNEAPQQRGELFVLQGTARRVVKIRVEDPEIVERFGIDHYYEMAIYTDDSQGNPIFFCVRHLPEGMPTGDDPRFGEFVRVAGFFFKTWGYRPIAGGPEVDDEGNRVVRRQLAPLLIGNQPVWYPAPKAERNPWIGAIAGGLFVLALVGIWIGVWRYSRSDKKFHEQTIVKTLQLDQEVRLDELGLEANDGPDFSGLAAADSDASAAPKDSIDAPSAADSEFPTNEPPGSELKPGDAQATRDGSEEKGEPGEQSAAGADADRRDP